MFYTVSGCSVPIADLPFLIGCGDAGNPVAFPDRRISRNCAAIAAEGGELFLEDRGNQLGVYLNGERVSKRVLKEGDVITFGVENSCCAIFHGDAASSPGAIVRLKARRLKVWSTKRRLAFAKPSSIRRYPLFVVRLNLLFDVRL